MFSFKLFVICSSLLSIEATEDPVVQIDDGAIRGKIGKTENLNQTYYAFQGIPFAQPPIGNLRFKPPIPPSKWNDTLNATKDASECVQGSPIVTGSEDCLYINVYKPEIGSQNLPVMVYIHGGGFSTLSSCCVGADYLLDEGVIYVSFNYRLGIFGFLSTGDLEQPGNNALRDQILALQWVQKNIVHFGGNPKSVTIFGGSAGGASISYLLQSKLTNGLFQHAIIQSGTSLCIWALTRKARQVAFDIGKRLNVNISSSTTLVEGLKKINATELQIASIANELKYDVEGNIFGNGLIFAPVKEVDHEGAVFTGNSHQLLSDGNFRKIPTLIGCNSEEANAPKDSIDPLIIPLTAYFLYLDLHQSFLTPTDLNISNPLKVGLVGAAIKLKYFGILPIAIQRNQFLQYANDHLFFRPTHETVKQQSKYAPVYYYRFSYAGGFGGIVNRTFNGAGHTEELGYIFVSDYYANKSASETDKLTRNRVVKLWTNFAKFGNPTPQPDALLSNITWSSAGIIKNNLIYLDINSDLTLQLNPEQSYMKFWDDLYQKNGNPPFDTY